MMIHTSSRSRLSSSLLSWLVSAAPVILFSIAIFFALEAGRSGQEDWQATAAFIQKIVITGVLLVVSVQLQFKNLNTWCEQE